MKRSKIAQVKADANRLLCRIDEMERCAGWTRYTDTGDKASSTHYPDDRFNSGQFTASVKRASMDLSRSLAEVRKP